MVTRRFSAGSQEGIDPLATTFVSFIRLLFFIWLAEEGLPMAPVTPRPPSGFVLGGQCAQFQEAYNKRCESMLGLTMSSHFQEVYRRGVKEGLWSSHTSAAHQWGVSRQMMQRIATGGSDTSLRTLARLNPRVKGFSEILMGLRDPGIDETAKRHTAMAGLIEWCLTRRRNLGEPIPTFDITKGWLEEFDFYIDHNEGTLISTQDQMATWVAGTTGSELVKRIARADWEYLRDYLPGREDAWVERERTSRHGAAGITRTSLQWRIFELRALRGALVELNEETPADQTAPREVQAEWYAKAEDKLPEAVQNDEKEGLLIPSLLRTYDLDLADFLTPTMRYNAITYLLRKSTLTRPQLTALNLPKRHDRAEGDRYG